MPSKPVRPYSASWSGARSCRAPRAAMWICRCSGARPDRRARLNAGNPVAAQPGRSDTGLMPPTESAVLVAVPEAEDVVGRFRARLDRSAAWGVPPHVTVLYPFVSADRIDSPVLDRLTRAVGSVPAFDVTLAR